MPILPVPVTENLKLITRSTVLKRILEEDEETAWAAALLGDPPSSL